MEHGGIVVIFFLQSHQQNQIFFFQVFIASSHHDKDIFEFSGSGSVDVWSLLHFGAIFFLIQKNKTWRGDAASIYEIIIYQNKKQQNRSQMWGISFAIQNLCAFIAGKCLPQNCTAYLSNINLDLFFKIYLNNSSN